MGGVRSGNKACDSSNLAELNEFDLMLLEGPLGRLYRCYGYCGTMPYGTERDDDIQS